MATNTNSADRVEHLLFMLARVTHELRTPLNAVMGFAELMRRQAGGAGAAHDLYLNHLQVAARHLSAVVSDLADLPQLHAGTLSLRPETVRVHDAVCEAITMVESAASGGPMALCCDGGHAQLAVRADGQRMVQILLNLLTNAVKYGRGTPNEAHVSWRRDPHRDCARIDVRDNGRGLDLARQSALFEPFNRLGAERTCAEGCGLGLYISIGLARAMGGDIEVDSRPGRGSTFTLVLPLAGE